MGQGRFSQELLPRQDAEGDAAEACYRAAMSWQERTRDSPRCAVLHVLFPLPLRYNQTAIGYRAAEVKMASQQGPLFTAT